jgi:N-acetylmuramic acid 6-phosphate etherase
MSQDRLDASLDIDQRTAREIVRIIQEQDARVAPAVAAEADRIANAIDQIAERMAHGGRLIYTGAGTSGRIAMLDASELPPTYGIDPSMVRVLMAGGEKSRATTRSSASPPRARRPTPLRPSAARTCSAR